MDSISPTFLAREIVAEFEAQAEPANLAGMARYGISTERTFGVTMPVIKAQAKSARAQLGRDHESWHELAALLWELGWREARLAAAFIDASELVTPTQMDAWAADFDSWDICDGVCMHLFDRTSHAWDKAAEWTGADAEFVKRAGFVLIASLASHDKRAPDERFTAFLPTIEREATDARNFVKKAVNWALRHIGKRNAALNAEAIACAERILASAECVKPATDASRAARWSARDALRELRSDAVRRRLEIG